MGDSAYNVLGLPDLELVSQHYETRKHQDGYSYDIIVYAVKHVGYVPYCHACQEATGETCIAQKHEKGIRYIKDLDAHGWHVELAVPVHRYKCVRCGTSFTEAFESFDSNARITNRLRDKIATTSLDRPFLQVAKEYDLTDTTVKRVFTQWVQKQDDQKLEEVYAPKVLGIDEAHLVGEMRCVLTDNEDNSILDILENRNTHTVKKALQSLKNKEKLTVVTMDMYPAYRAAVYDVFGGNVVVVVDHFHVIQIVTKQLNNIRVRLKKEVDKEDRKILRHDRHLLLTNIEDLSEADRAELFRIFKKFPQFKTAYSLKESFRSIYQCRTRIDAEVAFSKWASSVPKDDDRFDGFKTVIKTVKSWYTEIFNYFDYRYTNAFTECFNGIIKKMNRAGNGYSFEVLRAKMLYGTAATNHKRYARRQSMDFSYGFVSNFMAPLRGELKGFGVDVQMLVELIEDDQFFTEDNGYITDN